MSSPGNANLVQMQAPVVSQNQLTMSSREIADLTKKRHDNVLRDIKGMLEELNGQSSELRNDGSKGVRIEYDYRNFVSAYHLPQFECYVLITGYSITLRGRVIRRWMELEEQVRSLTITNRPEITKPSALARAWALQAAEWSQRANEWAVAYDKLVTENLILVPQATAYKTLSPEGRTFSMRDAAKAARLGIGGVNLMKVLKHVHHFNLNGMPSEQSRKLGYFDVKRFEVGEITQRQPRVTEKGIGWLSKNREMIHNVAEKLGMKVNRYVETEFNLAEYVA